MAEEEFNELPRGLVPRILHYRLDSDDVIHMSVADQVILNHFVNAIQKSSVYGNELHLLTEIAELHNCVFQKSNDH